MRLQRDVVQVMNVKYRGRYFECNKSMRVEDILFDFLDGSLEYISVVDNGKRYDYLDYNGFCSIFYSVFMDLVVYVQVINNALKEVCPLQLKMGRDITYSDKYKDVVYFSIRTKKVIVNAKALKMCRNANFELVPQIVAPMIGLICAAVGQLIHATYFKCTRLDLKGDETKKPKDVFFIETANLLQSKISYANCYTRVPPMTDNRKIVASMLWSIGS